MARRWRSPDALLLGTLALTLAAALAVMTSGPGNEQSLASVELRRALLGGPGLGRAVDLSRCDAAFDPRLGCGCELSYWPIPGAVALCPDHALPPPPGTR
jgi:hypothetical protein